MTRQNCWIDIFQNLFIYSYLSILVNLHICIKIAFSPPPFKQILMIWVSSKLSTKKVVHNIHKVAFLSQIITANLAISSDT